MAQGQYSFTDIDRPTTGTGQFSLTDIEPSPLAPARSLTPRQAEPPQAPRLITPRLARGYSPSLAVGGRTGRFNFDEPPETGGTPQPRYAFETDEGGKWFFQLETDLQGGRWEDAHHAADDYKSYQQMTPQALGEHLVEKWGDKGEGGQIAAIVGNSAMQGQSFAAMKQALRDAGLNTHRQISDWIKEPTVPPPVAARGTQRASAGTAPARAISPGTADRQSGKRPGPGIGPDPEKTGALGLRDFFSGLVTRDEGYRTLSPEGTALIPFTGPMADAVAAYDVVRAARRVRDGTDTAADLRILEAFQEQDAEAQQRGTTLLYDVASIVAHLPAFAVEFAATGGAFTGVKTLVEQSLLKVAPKIAAKRATQIAAKGAGYTAGAAAQEALMPQRVVAEAVRRQTPTPKELQDGLKDWDDDFVPALVRAVPDQFVEVFSERTGAALAGPAGETREAPHRATRRGAEGRRAEGLAQTPSRRERHRFPRQGQI